MLRAARISKSLDVSFIWGPSSILTITFCQRDTVSSGPALRFLTKGEVVRYDEGEIKGFLISNRERNYWVKIKVIEKIILEITVSKVLNNGKEEKWSDSETIPLEENKKELWMPIDEHFLFGGTPWLE